ncbi:DUF6714 family protein [Deinococcus apachensis]|uniref:DUF6714 family protein n=1 Tax=Deinococcus apachensis TaxID=309886 RepID=UPI000373B4F9|nr:DUF6714 family protein [Deinococcus apachensis]
MTEAENLRTRIRRAFTDVTLGGGVTLREARVLDRYGSFRERERARALDFQGPWWEVSGEDLEMHRPFSFLDAVGFAYYAPAYLTHVLSHDPLYATDTADTVLLGLWPRYSVARFGGITAEQAAVIAAYLEYAETQDPILECRAAVYTDAWVYWARRAQHP